MIVFVEPKPYGESVPSKQARKRRDASRIDSATVALWRDRRDKLHDKLAEHEQTEWDWLWRTRLSVLDYLIHRYAETLDAISLRDTPTRIDKSHRRSTTDSASQEPVSPYNQTPVDGTAWIADQKREAIQNRLASLRSANVQRHAKAEKLAEELREAVRSWQRPRRSEQPEHPDTLRLAEALRELDEREHRKLRRYIAFDLGVLDYTDEPLDNETIRQILTEHGIAPDQGD